MGLREILHRVSPHHLRTQVLAVVALTVAPLAATALYAAWSERQREIARARADVQWQARLLSRDLERLLRGTRDLILGLAQHPALRNRDAGACTTLFSGLRSSFPQYANLFVATADAKPLCSALPYPPSFRLTGQAADVFERAVERGQQTRDIVVAEYTVGQIVGKPVMAVAYLVAGSGGAPDTLVAASVDLLWLNQQMSRSPAPGGGVAIVLDRSGRILARSPASDQWLGQFAFSQSDLKDFRTQEDFIGTVTGLDGIQRLHAFQPVPSGDGLSVAVGLPRATIYSASQRALVWNLAGLGLVSLFVAAAAWLGTERLVMRRVSRLVDSAQRLKAGDLSVRTGQAYGGELGQLAEAFDQMAGALEEAQAEAARAAQAFRSVVEGTSAVTGADLFRSLVRRLAEALGVRCVWVGELVTEGRRVRTMAVWRDGQARDNFEYEAEDTPGAHVLTQRLLDSSGQPLGVLVALADQPPAYPETAAAMLRVFGNRAAAELERLRAERALRASEARFRRLMESGIIGIILANWDGRIVEANDAFLKLVGYSRGELLSGALRWDQMTPPEWAPVDAEAIEQLQRHGVCDPFEKEYIRKDGGRVPILLGVALLEGSDGLCICYVLDLTERKEAERSLRELSGRLLEVQDEERQRVARQLSDTTGQKLAALERELALVNQSSAGLGPKARQRLAEALELAQQCSREIQTVSYLLHPPLLDELGLAAALRAYGDGYAQRTGVQVDLHAPSELGRLPGPVELALFRIAQESLTNIHRHSGSPTAEIRLRREGARVRLDVADRGHGMPAQVLQKIFRGGAPPGVGITGMQERARLAGGRLEIYSGPAGSTVTAVLPLEGGEVP